MKTTVISKLSDDLTGKWDRYVTAASTGLPLHLSGWRDVLRSTYGYETCYLLARDPQHIVGVLPLFFVPSFLTGKRAMTLPGALCAEDKEIAASLIEEALNLCSDAGLARVLIQDSRQELPQKWHSESQHVYWLVDLGQSEEALWKKLDSNIRRQVRKAKKNNLEVEVDRSGELLDPFYEVFSHFTHQAGTPVFGRSFLENIINTFPNGFNIAVVWSEGTPIAAYFQLEMNDTIYGMWGAALPETLKLRPAYLALWEIMRDGIENEFTSLDMGRSPAESNASKFKGQWGGISHPIYQTIINGKGKSSVPSLTSQVQSNEQFQLFMKVWPRLPYGLTSRLGPRLRWHIPFA